MNPTTVLFRTFDIAEGCPADPRWFNLCIILDGKRSIQQLMEAFPSLEITIPSFEELVAQGLAAPVAVPDAEPICKDATHLSVECIQRLRQLVNSALCRNCSIFSRTTVQFEVERLITYGDFKNLRSRIERADPTRVDSFNKMLHECCLATIP